MNSSTYYFHSSSSDRRRSQFDNDWGDGQGKGWFQSTYSKLVAASVGIVALVVILNSTFTSRSSLFDVQSPVVKPLAVSMIKYQGFHSEMDLSLTSPGYGTLKSTSMLTWQYIAEPARAQSFKLNKITVNGQELVVDEEKMSVSWIIDGKAYSGAEISFTLPAKSYGSLVKFTVSVAIKKDVELLEGVNSLYQFTYSSHMAVKYVRREFRTLTSDDRSRFIKALQTVYSLDDTTGQQLYGSKFRSAEYFLYKHLTGAGQTDCDHWHDGPALVTHHAAFTLEMEQALQSVDPTVTIPYWEYGMDAYLYDNLEQSPIFAADFLGEMNPKNSEHRINDGSFWSTVKIPDATKYGDWDIAATSSLNPYRNAYGAMRSPWNNNPTSYMGRYNTTYGRSQYSAVPSCSLLQPCFQSDTVADMTYCLNGATHGPVHIMIGGAWGDEEIFENNNLYYVRNPDRVLLFKILWRMGFTRCPDSCDPSASSDDCRCSVPDEYITKYGAQWILDKANVTTLFAKQLNGATDEDYMTILRTIEHPGTAGEMFTSGAPFDPTFWPLHGSMERMLGLKRILLDDGIVEFDETWGYPSYDPTDGAAYLNGVCDWSGVANSSDLTLPTCSSTSSCFGHGEFDIIEFGNFLNTGETYTNTAFYSFLHPENEELPYVYDEYTFDYCADYGYDFLDASSSSSGKAAARGKMSEGKKLRRNQKMGAHSPKNQGNVPSAM